MYGRCSDCGTEEFTPSYRGRSDICPDCYILRGKLLEAIRNGEITPIEIQKVQKALANSHGSGRGKRAMEKALTNENT